MINKINYNSGRLYSISDYTEGKRTPIIAFRGDIDQFAKKNINTSRTEQVLAIHQQITDCQQLISESDNLQQIKEKAGEVLKSVSRFLDKAVFWNTSIQVPKIYNWAYMQKKGPEALINSHRLEEEGTPKTVALMVIDVDNLKKINSANGTVLAGNEVVHHLARTLKKVFPENIVTKFGGDEFFVLLENTTKKDAVERSLRLSKAIKEELPSYDNKTIDYTVSIGICTKTGKILEGNETIEDLKFDADYDFTLLTRKAVNQCTQIAKNSLLKGTDHNIFITSLDEENSSINDSKKTGKQLKLDL
ncbi:MAG: GGDEF domain-containing protein [Cyanobacteriota bacterium]